MALVEVNNVIVLDNPTSFTNPFQFQITFQCHQELKSDLEWKVTYVGSADNDTNDQVLEEVMVGPVPVGLNQFVLQANAPDMDRIPDSDLIGVTVILVSCSYLDNPFLQVGYYVNVTYTDQPEDPLNPPNPRTVPLTRSILAEEPRVTRFPIDWSGSNALIQDDEEANAEAAEYENREIEDDGSADNDGMEDDEDDGNDDGEVDLEEENEGYENENDGGNSTMEMIGNEDSMDVEQMQHASPEAGLSH